MRMTLIGVAGLVLSGCAGQPVRIAPVLTSDGEFRGPVVADRKMPVSKRYEGLCESRPYRWRPFWYRTYSDCPVVPVYGARTVIVRKG